MKFLRPLGSPLGALAFPLRSTPNTIETTPPSANHQRFRWYGTGSFDIAATVFHLWTVRGLHVEVSAWARELLRQVPAEKLVQAPSAIQVITSEEIRRSGVSTLPEALRLLAVVKKNSKRLENLKGWLHAFR